ncbi:MAG TPA: tyrosine-type recombinase/integrase, partial [Edaphobacter sp.]|nr:tyrosine-type recombinase/integrase [Edaphobacter sp.]
GKHAWKKRRRAICSASLTKTEAQRIFDEAILNHVEPRSRYPLMQATLREFWNQKYQPRLAYLKRKGREHYCYVFEKLIEPVLGEMRMADIGVEQVQALIDLRFAERKKDGVSPRYSPQTLLHIRHTISKMFKVAKQYKWYAGDLPIPGLVLPQMVSRERGAYTKQQFSLLVGALHSPAREMVFTVALLGLRNSELIGLKWKRLNLTDQPVLVDGEVIPPFTAAVREQFVRVARRQKSDPLTGKRSPVDPKEKYGQYQTLKGAAARPETSARRNVPIPILLVGLLQHAKAISKFQEPEDPVFAASTGKPVDAHNILQRTLKPTAKRLGLPDLCWHSLRHTSNTWSDGHLTTEEKRRVFGWSDDRMASRYSHPELERIREGMERLAEGLDRITPEEKGKVTVQ